MTLDTLVAKVLLKATGKTSTSVFGDTKYTKVQGIANSLIETWQEEPYVDWFSLYDPDFSIGTVTATDTYELDTEEIRKLSDNPDDKVRIVHTDGAYTDYSIVPADELKNYYIGDYCAQIGNNLVFNKVFSADDPQFGGDIQVPKYGFAALLESSDDVVPVDIPQWLVIMSAAEYVRNDITKQNQYPNLINEANPLMDKMKDNNDSQIEYISSSFIAPGAAW